MPSDIFCKFNALADWHTDTPTRFVGFSTARVMTNQAASATYIAACVNRNNCRDTGDVTSVKKSPGTVFLA